MISRRIDFDKDNNIYMDCYIHENPPHPAFPVNMSRPAVIVCPGGAYNGQCDREADPIALDYLAAGYNTFVLYYSIKERAAFPQPLLDLCKAVKYIRANCEELNILPNKIAVCGFSAGGHLTASLGTLWNNPEIQKLSGCEKEENKPNALILGYPVITTNSWMRPNLPRLIGSRDPEETKKLLDCSKNVGPHTPPAFLVHTFMDNAVSAKESLDFANALNENDIPFEMHIFPNGVHGLSTGKIETCGHIEPSFNKWMSLSVLWLDSVFSDQEMPDPKNRAKVYK